MTVVGVLWCVLQGTPQAAEDRLQTRVDGNLAVAASVTAEDLLDQFHNPSSEYGLVDCWWWEAEPLDKDKMTWQLEEMKAKGVAAPSITRDTAGRLVRSWLADLFRPYCLYQLVHPPERAPVRFGGNPRPRQRRHGGQGASQWTTGGRSDGFFLHVRHQ